MNKLFTLLLGLTTALVSTSAFAANTNNPLADTSWTLTSYDGTGTSGTLSFESDRMYSKFCNNVSQGYRYNNESITSTSPGMSTMMYCEGLPMTLENNFTITTGTSAKINNNNILTITTSDKHVFVFAREMQACTMEYAPVCGKVSVQCVMAPCLPVEQTFGNACTAKAAGATGIVSGECSQPSTGTIVGGDSDEHGCKASAGYSRSTNLNQCIRVREFEGILDFAIEHKITSKKTVASFRADDKVTRQEAASMLVAFAENIYDKAYASFPQSCNTKYRDDKNIASGLKKNVYTACALGLMKGRNGSFHPYASLTKAQAFKIISSVANIDPKSVEGSFDDKAITRGELIKLMHDAYTLQQSQASHLSDVSKKLEEARTLWQKKKLTDYTVTQEISCLCSLNSTGLTTFNISQSCDMYLRGNSQKRTVESMFKLIQKAINSNAKEIKATYDSNYGYPISLYINYGKESNDDITYTFTIKPAPVCIEG